MKNKKTVLILALTISFIIIVFAPKACAQQYDPESDFEVKNTGSAIIITRYIGIRQEVNIPPRIQNLPVIGIGDYAFSSCKNIAIITIPDSVISIGDGVFSGCERLTVINVASGNSAYTAENGVLYNKNKTLLHTCPKWKETFIIPESVTSIGKYAFSDCSYLISITIPDSVTNIGNYAFMGCRDLTSVTIPDSVISIGGSVFFGCVRLAAINVASANNAYISENGILYNKNKTLLHTYPARQTADSFIIPDSVTVIGEGAFFLCESLISITIPDSVTDIGNSSFSGCFNLTNVTIGNNVTSIGRNAFFTCFGLTNVTIPDSVINIGEGAFSGSGITSLTIGKNVTTIEYGAFSGCRRLIAINVASGNSAYTSENGILYNKNKTLLYTCPTGKKVLSFIIPDSVTNIVEMAFYNCTGLTDVTIPDSVTGIGKMAFWGCRSLTSVTFQGTIKSDSFDTFIPFPGDLREKFYMTNKTDGTPGTYTRPDKTSNTWTKRSGGQDA